MLTAEVRDMKRIEGNMFYDLIVSLFLYPQVIIQMIDELSEEDSAVKEDVEA